MSSSHIDRRAVFINVLTLSYLTVTSVGSTQDVLARVERGHYLSSPQECARECRENEPSKTCYYHFTVENYVTVGQACDLCTPNNTGVINDCQCVFADGFERTILTVNRMLPGPAIRVCLGDKVVVDVENRMLGAELTIHWHGLYQKRTPYYDGVPLLTQCPIPQGTKFRYQWYAENAGTHFWHAHTALQKMDGLFGSLIVQKPLSKEPNRKLYDHDLSTHVMLINDWMHEHATERFPGLVGRLEGQNPATKLINGKGQYRDPNTGNTTQTPLAVFTISPGQRYRFRMIDASCTVCPSELTIQGHTLTVIAIDGEPIVHVNVNTIISYAGERYDFVINGKKTLGVYWIQLRALGECGITRVQQLGVLRYTGTPNRPCSDPPSYDRGLPKGVVLNPVDGICNKPRANAICINQLRYLGSIDPRILQEEPDVRIYMPYRFFFYEPRKLFEPKTYNTFLVPPTGNSTVSVIQEISYQDPPSPPLSQRADIPPEQFCDSDNRPADCGKPCSCSHTKNIPLNSIVEIILIDEVAQVNLSHPFHLHGYSYFVMGMGRSPDKNVKKINMKHVQDLDRKTLLERNFVQPPAKDTVAVPNNGYLIFRFRADNPGYWLLHCHFVYHTVIGMEVVLHVGNSTDVPPIPRGFPVCGNYLPPITPNVNHGPVWT